MFPWKWQKNSYWLDQSLTFQEK